MKKIPYYIGILPEDQAKFWDFVFNMNEDTDPVFHINVLKEWDDPDGYYTFAILGTWESYQCFLDAAMGSFIKSVENFVEE
jgi:hypothetical protein